MMAFRKARIVGSCHSCHVNLIEGDMMGRGIYNCPNCGIIQTVGSLPGATSHPTADMSYTPVPQRSAQHFSEAKTQEVVEESPKATDQEPQEQDNPNSPFLP